MQHMVFRVKMMGICEMPWVFFFFFCYQELSLIEKTKLTFVRQLEAGGLLSCDLDPLSENQTWRKV